jgi:chromosomal replication initiation ATPase DnaA
MEKIENNVMNNCELMLKPKNKKQQQELDRYIQHLGLTTKGEIFILNCVLFLDWSRQKIVQSIEKIKEDNDGKSISFKITMRAPSTTTHYSTSNPYNEIGWIEEYSKSLEKRMFHVYHQMDYYTS